MLLGPCHLNITFVLYDSFANLHLIYQQTKQTDQTLAAFAPTAPGAVPTTPCPPSRPPEQRPVPLVPHVDTRRAWPPSQTARPGAAAMTSSRRVQSRRLARPADSPIELWQAFDAFSTSLHARRTKKGVATRPGPIKTTYLSGAPRHAGRRPAEQVIYSHFLAERMLD